mgnify:CR=1 FL=1
MALVVAAIAVVLLAVVSPHFLTTDNMVIVLRQAALQFLMAAGLTLVVLTGGIGINHLQDDEGSIGYWVAPAFWNAGYASEAVEGLVARRGLFCLPVIAFRACTLRRE